MAPAAMVFYSLASLCIVSAIMVVTRRSAVHAAMFLVLTFFGVAGIYVLMSAEFLAAVQILVYAGGIMVLFLFVIMLVPLQVKSLRPAARSALWSILLALLVASALIYAFWGVASPDSINSVAALSADGGNIETVGMELYRRYLLPFEVASVLLLVAMIGAVVLARRET